MFSLLAPTSILLLAISPVVASLSLSTSVMFLAIELLQINLAYLSLVYAILYIGGVVILLLFVIMLLDLREYDFWKTLASPKAFPIIICILSSYFLVSTTPKIGILATEKVYNFQAMIPEIFSWYFFQGAELLVFITLLVILPLFSAVALRPINNLCIADCTYIFVFLALSSSFLYYTSGSNEIPNEVVEKPAEETSYYCYQLIAEVGFALISRLWW